jgi:hypothetical protein
MVRMKNSIILSTVGETRRKLNRIFAFCAASALLGLLLLAGTPIRNTSARDEDSAHRFVRGALVVSRIKYEGNTFGNSKTYPFIFTDPNVSGVQGQIFIDQYEPERGLPRLGTLPLTGGISTSFSSKSEGALTRSVDGRFLTYMGYQGPVGAEGVSNSETPGATLTTNTAPTFNRELALILGDGSVGLTPETNAYSGDNPRAVITVDGSQFYMAGNADSSLNKDGSGPGTTIGARFGMPGSDMSSQLGVYFAADRPDETKKQHIKDNNFRGIGIFNGNLYVSKGSGGNGDDGVFQVHNGTGDGLPIGTTNTITKLFGAPAADPVSGAASPLTSFGFWFANPTTVYVADEGNPNLDAMGNLIPDPLAGLEKWSLVNGVWQLDYTIQSGLHLDKPESIPGYPVMTQTYGLRNLTGKVNRDGTVTIYAVTAQFSSISGGEPDPTKIVVVTDRLSAKKLPATGHDDDRSDWDRDDLDRFVILGTSHVGEVFRGVAFAPCTSERGHERCESDDDDH